MNLLTQKNAHILHKKVEWGKKMKSFSLILKWNVNMKQVFYEQMSYWWIYVWLVGNGEFPKKKRNISVRLTIIESIRDWQENSELILCKNYQMHCVLMSDLFMMLCANSLWLCD